MPEIQEEKIGGNFEETPSATFGIMTGCGKLYITICYDEKRRFKRVFIPRNSKFHCDLVMRDGLSRQATFQGKRSLKQLIRDLGGSQGHHCDKYFVNCEATSCYDAVAQAIRKFLKFKRKRK